MTLRDRIQELASSIRIHFARLVKRMEAPSEIGLVGEVSPRGSTALAPAELQNQLAIMRNAVAGRGYASPIPTAKRSIWLGIGLVGFTFFGLGTWAAVAPISSAAIAVGTIATAHGRQNIQHLEEGIIDKINVEEGTHVKAGDVLIHLNDTKAKADLTLLQGELDLAEANEARLLAERDGQPKITFPQDLLDRAGDPAVQQVMNEQTNFFNARVAAASGEKSILQQQIAEYQQQVIGYKAIVASKQEQAKLVNTELTDITGLMEQGYVTKSRVLSLQREQAQLDGDRGQAMAEISRAEQGIGEASRRIYQIDKDRQEEISKELHPLEGDLDELREKKMTAADVYKRTNIVAPMDGTVFNLAVHTLGAVITPGLVLMEIMPDHADLIVDAEINPPDIDSVHPGQPVSLRISLADSRLTPVIEGRLDEVSPDKIIVPNSNRSYYKARITIPADQVARLGDTKLKVGMPVEAMITRGSQTALHYVVKPLFESLARSFRER